MNTSPRYVVAYLYNPYIYKGTNTCIEQQQLIMPLSPPTGIDYSCVFPDNFAMNNFLGTRSLPLRRIGGGLGSTGCTSSGCTSGYTDGGSCGDITSPSTVPREVGKAGCSKSRATSLDCACVSERTGKIAGVSNSGVKSTSFLDNGDIFFRNLRLRRVTRRLPSTTT